MNAQEKSDFSLQNPVALKISKSTGIVGHRGGTLAVSGTFKSAAPFYGEIEGANGGKLPITGKATFGKMNIYEVKGITANLASEACNYMRAALIY